MARHWPDGAILSIAYDNVHYNDRPEAWNIPVVLGIATVLGIIGGRIGIWPLSILASEYFT